MTRGALPFRLLIQDLHNAGVTGDPDVLIKSICYDSRLAEPGSLFVALRGGYADGHDYLTDAARRGAVAALVEDDERAMGLFSACAIVADTRAALAPLSARFFEFPAGKLGMIGVTGTDGKTTTSYLIDGMLRHAGFRTGLIGTVAVRIGNEIVEHDTRQTTPESFEIHRLLNQMVESQVDWAILEATSHGLVMHRLDNCPFDIAAVTNITHEHLDFHGSVDAYRRAKARLLERIDQSTGREFPRGVVLNADDAGAIAIADASVAAPKLWYSPSGREADLRASEVVLSATGTRFRLHALDGEVDVELHLIGAFNVDNALAAAGVGMHIGLSLDQIAAGLNSVTAVPGRMSRIDQGQPFSVYVDYAHTPDSLEKAIRLLRSLVPGRIISVFGSAGERDTAKRPVQGAVSARLCDYSIFTSEDPRFEDPDEIIDQIAAGARAEGKTEGQEFVCIEDRRRAIQAAIDYAEPGDAVLLAGKGHEQCMIYQAERRPWDESTEARRALSERGFV